MPPPLHVRASVSGVLVLTALLASMALVGCSTLPGSTAPSVATEATEVTLPLVSAWYEDELVQYISTDTSDAAMAKAKNMHFVPALANALGHGQPGAPPRSVLARIYVFPDGSQRNVLQSMPEPSGFANAEADYSPLWQLYAVAWQPGRARRDLRSEDALLEAADRGDIAITPTRIVANCPVVYSVKGGLLPGAKLGYNPPEK
ncbi:hypothetical protein [Rhodoferax sp.]|uniref:DUF7482 domain-containing protein n=1 Tax=Rhodoferax sp. TaxID=50421 RepID=UPI00374D4C2A